jgi:hypothetical protein
VAIEGTHAGQVLLAEIARLELRWRKEGDAFIDAKDEIKRLKRQLNKAEIQQSWFCSKFLQALEIMECNDPLNAQLIKQTPAWGPRKQENDMNNEKMPTPESQAAYDLAYEAGLKCEDQPPLIQTDAPTKEDAMVNVATAMGYMMGINEHYKRKGIRTALFND